MTVNTKLPEDRRAAEQKAAGASGVAMSAAIGLVTSGLLWLAWKPTTRECNTLSECLGAPVSAAAMTLGVFVAALVVRRILQLRPVFVPTVLGFAGGGAVLVVLQSMRNIWPRELHAPLAPWWSWLLVGALFGGLAHWIHQPERRYTQRIVPVVVVLGLVIGGTIWVSAERDHRQLAELESVGVDTVMAPTFDDFSVSQAGRGQAESVGPFVRINLSARGGSAPAWPHAYLVPVQDRDLCEVAVRLTRDEGMSCVEKGDAVEFTGDYLLGSGVVDGDTLLLVTARVSPEGDEPDEWTLEALRSAVDRRVPTTLEDLRDGDIT